MRPARRFVKAPRIKLPYGIRPILTRSAADRSRNSGARAAAALGSSLRFLSIRGTADLSHAEVGQQFRGLAQGREPEEWRQRPAGRSRHGADPVLDLVLGIGDGFLREVRMRPGMRSDRVAFGYDLLEDFGVPGGVLPDR